MKEIFLHYLQAGIYGSVILMLIILLRPLLTKAPRKYLCLLWLVALLRFLLPFQIEAPFSLQPQTLPANTIIESQPTEIAGDILLNSTPVSLDVGLDVIQIIASVWGIVASVAIAYTMVSYCHLLYQVRQSSRITENIYENSALRTAFVLGYLQPKIYLPAALPSSDRDFILAHEKAHIRRGDNWWKLFAFLTVCMHWYNPIVWVGYVLINQDIEIACDESVVSSLALNDRKAYCTALLNTCKRLSGLTVCPVSFGEVSLPQRIRSVLSYKKPALWLTVVCLSVMLVLTGCFLTTPPSEFIPPEEPISTEAPTATATEPETLLTETEPLPTETEPIPSETEPLQTEPATQPPTAPPTETPKPPATQPTRPNKPQQPTEPIYSEEDPYGLAAIDAAATAYAARLGFQTADSYPSTKAKVFSRDHVDGTYDVPTTRSIMRKEALSSVDSAYRYCLDNGYNISNSLVWVVAKDMGTYMNIRIYCLPAADLS